MPPRRSDVRAAAGASPSHSRLRTLAVRIGLATAALAIAASTASAQKLQFRQITPDQGLSSSLVQAIVQDSRGFIWLGTKKGVDRYDGYTFTTYRHRADDSTTIVDNDAMTLYEDTQKILWIGSTKGLSRYDREHDNFQNFLIVPGDTVAVGAVLEAQGTLYVGTARGLYKFDRDRKSVV